MRYVLVVTYGRSGSTLLQGLLNALPGVLVRGENALFVHSLFQAYEKLNFAMDQGGESLEPTHPWFGSEQLNPVTFLQSARELVELQLLGGRAKDEVEVLGFKEIRYFDLAPDELRKYLDFLRLLLPGVAIVWHTRNHEDVARSGWWVREDPTVLGDSLVRFDETLADYLEKLPPWNWLHTNFDEVVVNTEGVLRDLASLVGVGYPPNRAEWVAAQQHSY
jgi:hypothetical protein